MSQPPNGYEPIAPLRAPVVPRVRATADSDPLPLEHHIQKLLDRNHTRPVNIFGPVGAGKTIALQHLAAVFGDRVLLLDNFLPNAPLAFPRLLVYATRQRNGPASFEMAEWTLDDIIEYLLHTHRDECRSVMQRLKQHNLTLPGNPELCARVIDEFLFDETLTSVVSAVRRAIRRQIADKGDYAAACGACLDLLRGDPRGWQDVESRIPVRLLHHAMAREILAAEQVADDVCTYKVQSLSQPLTATLRAQVAEMLRNRSFDPAPLEHVLLASPEIQSSAVSLLIAVDPAWRPTVGKLKQVIGVRLSEAQWADIDLSSALLATSNLSRADLTRADLSFVHAGEAGFNRARLERAQLCGAILFATDFSHANLAMANLERATLARSNMERADMHGVTATDTNFDFANLNGAIMIGALLERAMFDRATVAGTDFTGADLTGAQFSHVDLREGVFTAAVFRGARFRECRFEGLAIERPNFESADLVGSLFTGTVFRQANFRFANLRRTGLADVDWQSSDLRDVDFHHASFHMGSSRSGMVNSPLASEGTRTGFYTDDFAEQYYRLPEEIRKANLRGCDLRGALVHETDWYLVDLRDATCTEGQKEHFLKCGAILRDESESG